MTHEEKLEILKGGMEVNDKLNELLDKAGDDKHLVNTLNSIIGPSCARMTSIVIGDKFSSELKKILGEIK